MTYVRVLCVGLSHQNYRVIGFALNTADAERQLKTFDVPGNAVGFSEVWSLDTGKSEFMDRDFAWDRRKAR